MGHLPGGRGGSPTWEAGVVPQPRGGEGSGEEQDTHLGESPTYLAWKRGIRSGGSWSKVDQHSP